VQGQEEIDGMWMAGDGDALAPEDGWRMADRLNGATPSVRLMARHAALSSPLWQIGTPVREGTAFSQHMSSFFLNLFHVKNG
jgi:hypothetical protein